MFQQNLSFAKIVIVSESGLRRPDKKRGHLVKYSEKYLEVIEWFGTRDLLGLLENNANNVSLFDEFPISKEIFVLVEEHFDEETEEESVSLQFVRECQPEKETSNSSGKVKVGTLEDKGTIQVDDDGEIKDYGRFEVEARNKGETDLLNEFGN